MNKARNRIIALAATTAVALGGAVVAATPAQASSVWDAVAACESGGNWSINTGNGYYGGLQFSASTWRAYGGGEFASNADQATKDQQITVAQRTLAAQGPRAWPTCSVKAGLTKANGGAAASTTPAPAPAPAPAPKESTGMRYVTVKPGDTLSKIAREHGISGGWQAVWDLNKGTLSNPNVLQVGQQLVIG